ncbi:hypothetical protein MNBD_GAMMA03-2026 [hydrothermal vent metagenome]|uniref:PD-(D/E)XK nuclease superfamily protein n=1 Tax=hydrothermal vent metagenome TaxID=652676 RepID=A0A3B0W250_9ZZZZ
MNEINIDSIIENLKTSPIFNLSLSSRELFHSNFLYWIANNYPKEFGSMFFDFLKVKPKGSLITDIEREKKNIDLSFKYENSQQILIENKVKSIPYKEQLERYSKNSNPNKNFILLSLTKPNFELEDWILMSYEELHTKLDELIQNITNRYHKDIIIDYISFITELVKVDKLCQLNVDEKFNYHSVEKNHVYKKLQLIRLHDLYLKKKYELFAYKIFEKLNHKRHCIFGEKHDWKSKNQTIFINHGMTRAQGLTDIKYKISDNVLLCIQIQGEHFRLAIEDNNGEDANRIKEKLLHDKLWFVFENYFKTNDLIIYPTSIDKTFNKYGKVFYYQSIKLGTKYKISDLIEIIIKYIEHIDNNFESINSLTLKE